MVSWLVYRKRGTHHKRYGRSRYSRRHDGGEYRSSEKSCYYNQLGKC